MTYDPLDIFNLGESSGVGNLAIQAGASPGYKFHDLLTSWYLHFPYVNPDWPNGGWPAPITVYVAKPQLYVEENDEDVVKISSLTGCFQPASNTVYVGWAHPRNDNSNYYDIRYSWSDIHVNGWESAGDAPSGQNLNSAFAASYGCMEYSTTGISVVGHEDDPLYIAIKAQGETTFRQIQLTAGLLD